MMTKAVRLIILRHPCLEGVGVLRGGGGTWGGQESPELVRGWGRMRRKS